MHARLKLERRFAYGQSDALGQYRRLLRGDAWRQHDELVAAKSGSRVAAANVGVDALRSFAQCQIAGEVPMLVVDLLEAIEIDQQASETSALSLRARQLFLQAGIEIAAVVPAGEEIREAAADQSCTVDRVLDRE